MFWSSFIVFSDIVSAGHAIYTQMTFVGMNAAAKSHISFISFLLNKSNLPARLSSVAWGKDTPSLDVVWPQTARSDQAPMGSPCSSVA
jgi:hypothetical protein